MYKKFFVLLLTCSGSIIIAKTQPGHSPLVKKGSQKQEDDIFAAIISGNLPLVKNLITTKKVDVNQRPSNSPLNVAVQCGNLPIVDFLISLGADVNLHTPGKYTPLTTAAQGAGQNGDLKIAETLISAGADVNLQGAVGLAPLHFAAQLCNLNLTRLLISKGAKVNIHADDGSTPLHRIVIQSFPDCLAVIDTLIRAGADINATDNIGRTPLFCAAVDGAPQNQKMVVQALLKAGADPDIKNKDGKIAADLTNDRQIKDMLR